MELAAIPPTQSMPAQDEAASRFVNALFNDPILRHKLATVGLAFLLLLGSLWLAIVVLRPAKPDVQTLFAQVDEKLKNNLPEAAEAQLKEIQRLYPKEQERITRLRQEIIEKRLQPAEPDQTVARRHAKLIKQALDALQAGDPEEARFSLQLAKDLKVPGEEARRREKEVEEGIGGLEKKKAEEKEKLGNNARRAEVLRREAAAEQQRKEEYDKLIREAEALFKAGEFEATNRKALEARDLMPAGKEAAEWLAKIAPKLDDQAKRKAQEQAQKDREAKLAAALKAAEEHEAKGQFEEALASLQTAFAIEPQNERAAALQERVLAAVKDRRKKEQQQKKEKDLEDALIQATQLAVAGAEADLDEAARKVAEAGNIFPGDKEREAAIAAVAKKIADSRELLKLKKLKAEYADMLQSARDARINQRLDDALQFAKRASASKMADSRAEDIMKQIEEAIAERSKLIEYDKLLAQGDNFDKAADSLKPEALDDKAAQLELALGVFAKAKALKAEGPATKREAEVKQKLDQVKAAKADLVRKQEEAARKAAAAVAPAQKTAETPAPAKKQDDAAARSALAEDAARKQQRDTACASLKKTLEALGPAGDLAGAQAQFNEFKTKYPADPDLAALDALLKQKSVDVAAAKNLQEHNAALDKVRKALAGDDADEAEKRLDAFKGIYPNDPNLPKFADDLKALKDRKAVAQPAAKKEEADASKKGDAETTIARIRKFIEDKKKSDALRALKEAEGVLDEKTITDLRKAIKKIPESGGGDHGRGAE
ncbi:MAG: hypothetical protein ABSE73_16395 [Planctomycetota bacterium]